MNAVKIHIIKDVTMFQWVHLQRRKTIAAAGSAKSAKVLPRLDNLQCRWPKNLLAPAKYEKEQ